MNIKAFKNMNFVDGGVCAAKGFKANGVHCGISRKALVEKEGVENAPVPKKNDLAMIVSDTPCTAAAMYTTNKVQGAPIAVTKENLKNGMAQAVIVNSVNANTCNADGVEKAEKMCELAADALGLDKSDIIVASTGVIGQPLPIEPIIAGVPALAEGLSYEGNTAAVNAIMTTDT
jgi:glutamate N-acetyltransferase/amino-acid N-acetyltransferase